MYGKYFEKNRFNWTLIHWINRAHFHLGHPVSHREEAYIVGTTSDGVVFNRNPNIFFVQIPYFAISKIAKNQFLNWEKV